MNKLANSSAVVFRSKVFDKINHILLSATGTSTLIFNPNSIATVLSLTIQLSAADTVQLLDLAGSPLSNPYRVAANSIWSVAPRLVTNNSGIILKISGAATANVEILWANGNQIESLYNFKNDFSGVNASSGTIIPNPLPISIATKTTYYCAIGALTLPASPTEIFNIQGSNNKVIKIKEIFLGGLSSAAGSTDVWTRLRTAANTGGVSSVLPAIPADPNSIPASATITAYSTNPTTLGTNIGITKSFLTYSSSGLAGNFFDINFGGGDNEPLILRSNSQWITVTLTGDTQPAGANVSGYIKWTEE